MSAAIHWTICWLMGLLHWRKDVAVSQWQEIFIIIHYEDPLVSSHTMGVRGIFTQGDLSLLPYIGAEVLSCWQVGLGIMWLFEGIVLQWGSFLFCREAVWLYSPLQTRFTQHCCLYLMAFCNSDMGIFTVNVAYSFNQLYCLHNIWHLVCDKPVSQC